MRHKPMLLAIGAFLALTQAVSAAATGGAGDTREPSARCFSGDVLALDPAGAPKLHLGTQSYPQTLDVCDRQVVLTFDDGPSPATTPRVLRALRDAGVHATFFLIGRNASLHPELARREAAEGHTVGHHSDTHPSFTLRGFDEASAEADIANGIAADERAVYGATADPGHPHVPFFRFPGFADTPALLAHLDGRGIAVFGSDLWAADWLPTTPDEERARILGVLERRPHHNGILLLHDSRRSTAAMLPDLLRDLKAKGYRITHLVYENHAPPPPLTPPRSKMPETATFFAHQRPPIVEGAHHLAGVEPPGEVRR